MRVPALPAATPVPALVALVVLVALLAGCGPRIDPAEQQAAESPGEPAPDPLDEPAEAGDGAEGGDAADDAEQTADEPGDCGMPPFELTGVPWGADPSAPDEVQARGQGTALVWYDPDAERSLQLIVGQRLSDRTEPDETGTVRGHDAVLWWGSEPGSGPLFVHWQESDDPCEQYLATLAPASDTSELTALLPQ